MEGIIHIGTGRTGTTSLQCFLRDSSALLNENGFGYTKTLGDGNNIDIAKYGLLNCNNPYLLSKSIVGIDDKNNFDITVKNRLKSEIDFFNSDSIKKVIISSEHFTTDLRDIECVEKIKGLLNYVGINVTKIIIYIREQTSYLYSDFTTRVAMGMATSDKPKIPKDITRSPLDHSTTIGMWENVFPESKMIVRIFEKEFMSGNNTIPDFLNLIGLNGTIPIEGVKDTNTSLSRVAIKFLIDYNRLTSSDSKFSHLKLDNAYVKGKVLSLVRQVFPGEKMRPSNPTIKEIEKVFHDSNEKVRLKFFPERASLFKENSFTADYEERDSELERMTAFVEILRRYIAATKHVR